MKAVVKTRPGIGNIEYIDMPEPVCDSKGVKIEVKFSGICGTDIHIFHETFKNYPPVILGHEFSGKVVEVGEEVKKVRPGDRVTVLGSNLVTCDECEYCKQGYYMFCSSRKGMGHTVNGSFTKYAVVRERNVYKIPDTVSFEEAALTEAFAATVQPIEEFTSFNAGDVVLLSGPGPIGLLCLSLIVSHGCKVIVAGTKQDKIRLELAKRIGADIVVNVDEIDNIVNKETKGIGVDIAVECSGSSAGIANSLRLVKKMGKYIQVGIIGKEIVVNFDTILYKQLQVFGTLGHSLKTWERTMKILEQRKIDLTPVISHKLPLSRWKEAFDICENKTGAKVLLYYDEV